MKGTNKLIFLVVLAFCVAIVGYVIYDNKAKEQKQEADKEQVDKLLGKPLYKSE